MNREKLAVGLDFGTTYSCIGVWRNGGVEIIPNEVGERTTPSVIVFESKNKILVGEETLNHICKNPKHKIYEIKRLIGKKYDEIKDFIKTFTYDIIKDKMSDRPLIQIKFEDNTTLEYYPEQLASLIIKKMIKSAQIYLNNQKITDIVITIPAYFDNSQRNGIKKAVAILEDINLIQIINEPSAAALAYDFSNKNEDNLLTPFEKKSFLIQNENVLLDTDSIDTQENLIEENQIKKNKLKKILIFDLGGGTYDVSLIDKYENTNDTRCFSGDPLLGGANFDLELMNYCIQEFVKASKIDTNIINANNKAKERLKIACEASKKMLSYHYDDNIYLENFINEETLNVKISRAKFEKICENLFQKLEFPLEKILKISKWKTSDINEVVLVGGSSKIPKIKEILTKKFEFAIINDSINPDESVAFGATILAEKNIRKNSEQLKDFNFRDAIPFNIGIAVQNKEDRNNDLMGVVIKRGDKYPLTSIQFYHNIYNNQETMEFKIYEGDKRLAKDNRFIDKVTLTNIPKKRKEELIVRVEFKIDENGILTLDAMTENEKMENVSSSVISINSDIENINKAIFDKKLNLDLGVLDKDIAKKIETERKLKKSLKEYTNFIKNEINNKSKKFEFIKKYNNILIQYLKFLEESNSETESTKYLYLAELLFISYNNMYNIEFSRFLNDNIKKDIETNSKNCLNKIINGNPFHIKQLLINFKDVENDNKIFYTLIVYCLNLLKEKGEYHMRRNQKNSNFTAKNIFEECLLISKKYIKGESDVALADENLYNEYKNILTRCQEYINKISADSLDEIENTKKNGKLFSNLNSLSEDDLFLLLFHFDQSRKNIDLIGNINNNNDALLTKSICLANMVKIEFIFLNKKNYNTLKRLDLLCKDCISIAENLGNICTNKEWYNEIIKLHEEIKQIIKEKEVLTEKNKQDLNKIKENMRTEFEIEWGKSALDIIKTILKNYPYDGYENEKLADFDLWDENNDEKNKIFLMKLINKYSVDETDDGEFESKVKREKYLIIVEYLNKLINQINNNNDNLFDD